MKLSVSSYSFNQYLKAGKMILPDTVDKAAEMGFEGIDPTMSAEVTYTDHYGAAHTVTVEGKDFVKYTDTMYAVKIDGLVVADARQTVSVVIKLNGTTMIEVTDSIESYVARSYADGPVFIPVLRFADAAFNYFHPAESNS